ncbi:MAG: hypothetical protein WCS96_02700 [Victivallales bacterium]|jgi:hypothetical protein
MKKNEEFKVMPWLRGIREKHAGKIEGMTPSEIISESKKRKKIKPHAYEIKKYQEEPKIHSVAEIREKYRTDKGGKQC